MRRIRKADYTVTRKQLKWFSFLSGEDFDNPVGEESFFPALTKVAALGAVLIHVMLWGTEWIHYGGTVLAFLLLLVSTWPHEALHYIGFRLAGVPASSLRIRLDPPKFARWAGACEWRGDVSLAGWRLAVIAPCAGLSVIPILLGLSTGAWWLTLYGSMHLPGCRCDLRMLWLSRGFKESFIKYYSLDPDFSWAETPGGTPGAEDSTSESRATRI